jgi:hypothetical protein
MIVRFLVLALLVGICTIGLWGQSPPIGAVVQTSNYDAAKGVATVRIVNTSHKDITAIALIIVITNPDGTAGSAVWGNDFLYGIISTIEQGHEISPGSGHGIAPGATFDQAFPQSTPITNFRATVDVVVYADGTADVLDESVFKRIALERKGRVLALQKANELLANSLANPEDAHPSITVAAQLRGLANVLEADRQKSMDEPASYEALGFRVAAQAIANAPKDPTGRSAREDDYLRALAKTHSNRVSLISPHTELVKEVRP